MQDNYAKNPSRNQLLQKDCHVQRGLFKVARHAHDVLSKVNLAQTVRLWRASTILIACMLASPPPHLVKTSGTSDLSAPSGGQ